METRFVALNAESEGFQQGSARLASVMTLVARKLRYELRLKVD